MAAPVRRRKVIGRRRVEDEGEDEGGPDHLDADDDSLTDGSVVSDDNDLADDSDTSNVDEASPTAPTARKANGHGRTGGGNGSARRPRHHASDGAGTTTEKPKKPSDSSVNDTEFMLNGLSITDAPDPVKELDFEEEATAPSSSTSAPIIVSSNSAPTAGPEGPPTDRRRREHDEYRRKRDEDPAFVPNRGAFFMHDHRHAGPSANGFRPFGRGGRGGRGRGAVGGPFAPMSQHLHNPADPTTSAPWAHDMHDSVAKPMPARQPRHPFVDDGPPNGDGYIPTCPNSSTPINRHMATEKVLGTVQIRVYIPSVKEPVLFPGITIKQYTKLPDHRPPLRRDKPVRISLPNLPPRFRFPAEDRSFIFIPRALRPNQQRLRGKPRSGLGSIGGFSRRTSVFGGSYYGGSAYSPSIGLSRRSSIAPDIGRDFIVSPSGSAISRPPLPHDSSRPVVRLPPQSRPEHQMPAIDGVVAAQPPETALSTINDIPQPQTHPLPSKPAFQENRSVSIPMHQPRPQKTVSVADIESPTVQQIPSQPYQQAFHQQVPIQVSNGFGHDAHARHSSYPSQHSTGTPLSQIPERAIHAAPFQPQPAQYAQQNYYPPYQMNMGPQGFYYPQPNYPSNVAAPSATAPPFVPGMQQGQPQGETPSSQPSGQSQAGSNLVAQEINGMVYYFDASQIPSMAPYPPYPTPQGYPMPDGMNNMAVPNPDGYYYPPSGPVYYPQ